MNNDDVHDDDADDPVCGGVVVVVVIVCRGLTVKAPIGVANSTTAAVIRPAESFILSRPCSDVCFERRRR